MQASRDEYFMGLALERARTGARIDGAGQVGCVIVRGGEVLASGHTETEMSHDPTAHAEIVTLRRLGRRLETTDFSGCTLYCTLEPCGMCSLACVWARVSRIVFGAARSQAHSLYFDQRHYNTLDFVRDAFNGNIQVTAGVRSAECAALYEQPGEAPDTAREEQAPRAPVVGGIAETCLYVADLDRSEAFYTRVFEFRPVFAEPGRMSALAIPNRQMLLLFKTGASVEARPGRGGVVPGHDARGHIHLAFSIPARQLPAWEQRLDQLQIPIESRVAWPRGGHSLYFRDPDSHLLELITPGCWPD